jgi:hypothetical protein
VTIYTLKIEPGVQEKKSEILKNQLSAAARDTRAFWVGLAVLKHPSRGWRLEFTQTGHVKGRKPLRNGIKANRGGKPIRPHFHCDALRCSLFFISGMMTFWFFVNDDLGYSAVWLRRAPPNLVTLGREAPSDPQKKIMAPGKREREGSMTVV